MMYGAYAVGVLVTTPVFGMLSDRVGRRTPILVGFAVQALATILFAMAGSVGAMLVARLFQGIASAATWTIGLALVAEHFTEHRAEKMGVAMMGSTGGLLLGPAAGGLLLQWGGYRVPFVAAGLLLAVDGILRFAIVTDARHEATESAGSDLPRLLRDRSVLAAALIVVLSSIGWSLLEPLFPSHVERVAGASPATVGILFTIASLMYGLTAPLVGKAADRYGAWPTMTFGVVAMAVTLPLLAMPTTIVLAAVALVLVDVSYGFLMNPTLAELAAAVDRTGGGAYASVYAIYNMAYSVGTIGTTLTAGVLAGAVSFQVALGTTSVALLACLPLLTFLRRGMMRTAT
jgi:DHA1 family solute carrier family 18 vesicular amine transporter 1/2